MDSAEWSERIPGWLLATAVLESITRTRSLVAIDRQSGAVKLSTFGLRSVSV